MGRGETDRKAEWTVGGCAIDEFQRILPETGGFMGSVFVFRIEEVFSALTANTTPVIKLVRHILHGLVISCAELADKAGVIAVLAQYGGISLRPLLGLERSAKTIDFIPSQLLPAENHGAAATTNRRGDKMVLKKPPIFGQSVDVRVTHATQGIPSLVIGTNEYDVGLCRLGFLRS